MINLRQVLTGEPTRLRYIKRFSICPRVHEESVAEHSFYVGFICLMLAEDLIQQGKLINLGRLLSRALLHDLDEVFSGDFIRMFKHNNAKVKDAIDETSCKLMTEFAKGYPAGSSIMYNWSQAKTDDIEGRILRYADFLSVLSYIWQEVHSGNVVMLEHTEELMGFGDSFTTVEYVFLQQYNVEVASMLSELWRMTCRPR